MKYSAVIPAGGYSTRYGHGNKLFELLNGKPVLIHAVEQFRVFCEDHFIVIPVHADYKTALTEILDRYLPGNNITVVTGGSDRTRSVLNAVNALPGNCDLTAVHDAARPLIRVTTIKAVFDAAEKYSAAAAARRVTSTLKQADENGFLSAGNINRDFMWEIETPQTFRTELLRKALRENYRNTTTVLVTQRISSLCHADLILVLSDGQVIGAGKHEELMASCEEYQLIAHTQMGEGKEVG